MSKKKNTCWYFGDSFTQSMWIDNPSLDDFYKGKERKSWSENLSKYLNCNCKNLGYGGNSPQGIIDDFINNINKIKKGDYVFISTSPMVRTVGYDPITDKISTWNLEQISHMKHWPKHLEYKLTNTDKWTYGTPDIVNDNVNIMYDYITNLTMPYEDKWEIYFENKIKNLIEYFTNNGIHMYYWSFRKWNDFTSLTKETNGLINDEHWGMIGESEFLKYMKKRIKNKHYFEKGEKRTNNESNPI